jgi:hypothetical protein
LLHGGTAEFRCELRCRGVPLVRALAQGLFADGLERWRECLVPGIYSSLNDLFAKNIWIMRRVRKAAGQQFIENDPKAVDVASMIGRLSFELLRTHVTEGA